MTCHQLVAAIAVGLSLGAARADDGARQTVECLSFVVPPGFDRIVPHTDADAVVKSRRGVRLARGVYREAYTIRITVDRLPAYRLDTESRAVVLGSRIVAHSALIVTVIGARLYKISVGWNVDRPSDRGPAERFLASLGVADACSRQAAR